MPWELRKGRLYFYEATWENGRCVKRYCGTGLAGKAAAEKVALRAERKALERITYMKLMDSIKAAEMLYADARRQADKLMEAGLLADGCYQASHTWRRRRQNERRDD